MSPAKKNKKYSHKCSPFYKLTTRKKLAKLLYCAEKTLCEMASKSDSLYKEWVEPKKSGAFRLIEAPRVDLKEKQSRIADLLSRIAPPDYLMAPVKKRSYVDNAASHRNARAFRLLDIEDFFPSCKASRVHQFFLKNMHCSPDVAAILTQILTRNGYLPQGSPASPAMAFFAYKRMWEEIHMAVKAANCLLTVYIDDITISGSKIPEKLIWEIKSTLRRHGLRYKPQKERAIIDRPSEITGVIVDPRSASLSLPNRQHRGIYLLRRALADRPSMAEAIRLKNQLRGRLAQAAQVNRHSLQIRS